MKKLKLFSLALMALFATNVWAAYDTLYVNYTNTTKGDYFKSYTVDTKSVTLETPLGISSSSGDYYVSMGTAASDASSNYLSVLATQYIDSISFLLTGNSTDKTLIPALLCWKTSYDSDHKTLADSAIVHAGKSISNKGFANAEWFSYDLSRSDIKEVRLFKQAKNIVIGTASKANFPASDPQTLQIYGVRIKLRPSCTTTITTQPEGKTIAVNEENPTLSIVATNAASYAWKESSNGTLYDGASTLSTEDDFTPEINDAVQTKYYYCEVTSSCDGGAVVKSNIVTVNVVASIVHVTGVTLDITEQVFTLGETVTATLTATVAPADADNKAISWSSSAPTIVSVTDNGDGTADIEGLAEGSATITVTTTDGSKTATCNVTVNPNPCATYFWFFSEGDQTKNGKTNATTIFSDMFATTANQSGSLTVDGTKYSFDKRTGDPTAEFGKFSIPENKAGTFYAAAITSSSSADGTRQFVLTEATTEKTYQYEVVGNNTTWRSVEIDNLPTGSYTMSKASGNLRLGMIVLKLCDADYWTITFDSDGGSSVANLSVLDGTKATQPANPTKAGMYFAGWYNGEDKYDWDTAVTTDLSLKAKWSETPTALDNVEETASAVKRIENGMLIIEKNGIRYNAQGQVIR